MRQHYSKWSTGSHDICLFFLEFTLSSNHYFFLHKFYEATHQTSSACHATITTKNFIYLILVDQTIKLCLKDWIKVSHLWQSSRHSHLPHRREQWDIRTCFLYLILKPNSLGIFPPSHLTIFYLHSKWIGSQVTWQNPTDCGCWLGDILCRSNTIICICIFLNSYM